MTSKRPDPPLLPALLLAPPPEPERVARSASQLDLSLRDAAAAEINAIGHSMALATVKALAKPSCAGSVRAARRSSLRAPTNT